VLFRSHRWHLRWLLRPQLLLFRPQLQMHSRPRHQRTQAPLKNPIQMHRLKLLLPLPLNLER
jgi:hypothetical protein